MKQKFLNSSFITGLILMVIYSSGYGQITDTVKPNTNIVKGSPGNVLNTGLLSFSGYNADNSNFINWRLSTAAKPARMSLERSADGSIFSTINDLLINSNSDLNNYTYQDTKPLADKNIYRLRMTDNGGNVSYSTPIIIHNKTAENNIQVLLDAQAGKVTVTGLQNGRNYQLKIYSCTGQMVSKKDSGNDQLMLSIADLPHGLYVAYVTDGSATPISKKIIW